MDKLPKSIWIYIYSFDPTYYNKFNKVINELLDVTSMWGLFFHHKDLKDIFQTTKHMSLKQANKLSKYWNDDFLLKPYNNSYKRYYNKRDKFCSPVHISDIALINTFFPRLKANIESSSIIKNGRYNNI
jgi:hypothetical protein